MVKYDKKRSRPDLFCAYETFSWWIQRENLKNDVPIANQKCAKNTLHKLWTIAPGEQWWIKTTLFHGTIPYL